MSVPELTGVVHLRAIPGDPGHDGQGFDGALRAAIVDARALCAGGIDGIIVENFGSWPFPKGTPDQPTPPWQVAFMARAVSAVIAAVDVPVGVNVLRNDARAALGIAAATGAQFIRVNVHSGSAWTDQGLIEGRAFETLRLRAELGASQVHILADVRVKHAAPTVERPLSVEVEELVARAGADGVIVTGRGTGHPVDPALLAQAAQSAGGTPVLIGSGLTPDLAHLAEHADGAIVGTWVKEEGQLARPVDAERVATLVRAWRAHSKRRTRSPQR